MTTFHRRATREDFAEFFNETPVSFRAIVAEDEAGLLGIGGIYYCKNAPIAFSSMKPRFSGKKFAIARTAIKIMQLIGDTPCFAFASDQYKESDGLLRRLGFRRLGGRLYGR